MLDTNTVLSALIFASGRLGWLRPVWQERRLVPLGSRDTITELLRVLSYPKFRLSPERQQDLSADYLPWVEAVTIPIPPPKAPRCRDAKDMMFLELAITGRADYLVTGDGDLQALRASFRIPIVTPAELRALLPGGDG